MLVKLLSENDKAYLLKLAELLSIADKPLLWDGKRANEITPKTDIKKVAFAKGEAESNLLSEWSQKDKVGLKPWPFPVSTKETEVEKLLLEWLADIPLDKNTETSIERFIAVSEVLQSLLKGSPATTRYANRIMLYDLMLMTLASGEISSIEYRFLEIFKQHHKVDDSDFDEILERAKTTYREVQKTIALILE
jgi:hypothetical protein